LHILHIILGSIYTMSGNAEPAFHVETGVDEAEPISKNSVILYRISAISVVMLLTLTLLGNITVVVVIRSRAELWNKRINRYMLSLSVADMLVCVVTLTTEIQQLFVGFGRWVLGNVGCKLVTYGQLFTLASTAFLLTAMSIDHYQV